MAGLPNKPQEAHAGVQPWWRRLLGFGAAEARPNTEVVFPPGFLESLERLRILAVRAAGGGLKEGHRLGAYKGGQLEFHDYRNYVPGDDLRYLDWNLYARLGKPFIKEFAREEAGSIHLLLDATPSMALGAPSKWTFARRVAALFAHIGWSARDRVDALVYRGAGQTVATYPFTGKRGASLEFIDWLGRQAVAEPRTAEHEESFEATAAKPAAEGALREAVQKFLRMAPARGRVFILSDFWQEEAEILDAVQRLSASGHDLTALHVLAQDEAHPPDPGELRILSVEDAGEVELSATASAVQRYQQELEAHCAAVEGILRRRGGQYLFEHSDTSLERVLLQAFKRRRWVA